MATVDDLAAEARKLGESMERAAFLHYLHTRKRQLLDGGWMAEAIEVGRIIEWVQGRAREAMVGG